MFVKKATEIAPDVRVCIVQFDRAAVGRFRLHELAKPHMGECEIIQCLVVSGLFLLPLTGEIGQIRPRASIA